MKTLEGSVGRPRLATGLAIALAGLLAAGVAQGATLTSKYLIIATGASTGTNDVGDALNMQDSEIGAISAESGPLRFNAVSPPQGNPGFGAFQGPSTGIITLDGDAALTSSSGEAKLSNSDVHAINTGAANPGSQGIDCAASFNTCSDNGSNISSEGPPFGADHSSSGFNQTGLPGGGPVFSQVDNNNGIQGNIAMAALIAELGGLTTDYWNLAATQAPINSSGLNNETNSIFATLGSGLHVIDIDTNGNDFSINNSNFVVSGQADTFVIFRIEQGATLLGSNANFLLAGGIGQSNILFLVDADSGEGSFGFSNVEFFGYSFWDYGGIGVKNEAVWNNVRGCGQVVTDKVNFNNVSMVGCEFNPSTSVPEPSILALLGIGLVGVGLVRRKKA